MTDLARDETPAVVSDEQLAEWERVAAELAPPDTLPAVRISRVDRLLMAVPLLVRALRDARAERDDAQAAVGNVAAIVADRQMEADELRRLLRGAEAELGALRANREALATAWRRLSDRVEDAEARLDRIRRSRAVLGAGPHDYDSFCADVDAALAAPTGDRQDWTADANGRSNSSDTFVAIVAIVARLLRSEMWSITQDDAGRESAARLIVAQLAHKHGFAPVAAPTGQEATSG